MTLKEAYIAFINLPMVLTRIADNYLEYKTGEQTITYFSDKTLSLDRTGIFDSRFYVLSACSDADIQNQVLTLNKAVHTICGQSNKFNDFTLGLINDFMVVKMDNNIEKFPKVFEDFKNQGIFVRYYEMKDNSVKFKSTENSSILQADNKTTELDVTSRGFDRIINYVLKKQQIYRLHKIYDNGLEFSAPGMFFGTIVAYDDDSKTVQIQYTRSFCNRRKTFIDQPYNVIGEYICELLNPHARLGAIVYEPIKEEKEIEHIVTPSTNYYLFRGLKTNN